VKKIVLQAITSCGENPTTNTVLATGTERLLELKLEIAARKKYLYNSLHPCKYNLQSTIPQ
jgi:hypothetical protein